MGSWYLRWVLQWSSFGSWSWCLTTKILCFSLNNHSSKGIGDNLLLLFQRPVLDWELCVGWFLRHPCHVDLQCSSNCLSKVSSCCCTRLLQNKKDNKLMKLIYSRLTWSKSTRSCGIDGFIEFLNSIKYEHCLDHNSRVDWCITVIQLLCAFVNTWGGTHEVCLNPCVYKPCCAWVFSLIIQHEAQKPDHRPHHFQKMVPRPKPSNLLCPNCARVLWRVLLSLVGPLS